MSYRVTNSMISQTVLSDIQNVQAELSKTQERMSSGKQLTKLSDDPFAASWALFYRTDLAVNK